MRDRSLLTKIKRLAKLAYLKLIRIKDSPLKVALGFGLGVFVGIMPLLGPAVALLLAFIFRVNRVSALVGSLLFNTWFSFIVLLLAIKIGAGVMGRDYHDVHADWDGLIKGFKWEKLFDTSIYDVFVPVGVGYLIISLFFTVAASIILYMIIVRIRNKKLRGAGLIV